MHSPSKYNLCIAAAMFGGLCSAFYLATHITLACDAWDGASANVLLFNFVNFN